MGRAAFVVGGTGLVGRRVASVLAADGWQVTVGSRHPPDPAITGWAALGVEWVRVDRTEPGALEDALGDGVDVLIDTVAYTAADAQGLIGIDRDVGSIVAISSMSVYVDDVGRSLEESADAEFPEPITEDQPTVEPGPQTYSSRKVEIERTLLDGARVPVTILRPGAVHGPGDGQPREWHFVKRVLDRRRVVVLNQDGRSRFHTTSVLNLAEMVRAAARSPGMRVLNCGNPDPPSATDIARQICGALRHEWEVVTIPGGGPVGDTPWSVPMVMTTKRAERELAYRPVTTYGAAVQETCDWLVRATTGKDWIELFPTIVPHMDFDYTAEDTWLASRHRSANPR